MANPGNKRNKSSKEQKSRKGKDKHVSNRKSKGNRRDAYDQQQAGQEDSRRGKGQRQRSKPAKASFPAFNSAGKCQAKGGGILSGPAPTQNKKHKTAEDRVFHLLGTKCCERMELLEKIGVRKFHTDHRAIPLIEKLIQEKMTIGDIYLAFDPTREGATPIKTRSGDRRARYAIYLQEKAKKQAAGRMKTKKQQKRRKLSSHQLDTGKSTATSEADDSPPRREYKKKKIKGSYSKEKFEFLRRSKETVNYFYSRAMQRVAFHQFKQEKTHFMRFPLEWHGLFEGSDAASLYPDIDQLKQNRCVVPQRLRGQDRKLTALYLFGAVNPFVGFDFAVPSGGLKRIKDQAPIWKPGMAKAWKRTKYSLESDLSMQCMPTREEYGDGAEFPKQKSQTMSAWELIFVENPKRAKTDSAGRKVRKERRFGGLKWRPLEAEELEKRQQLLLNWLIVRNSNLSKHIKARNQFYHDQYNTLNPQSTGPNKDKPRKKEAAKPAISANMWDDESSQSSESGDSTFEPSQDERGYGRRSSTSDGDLRDTPPVPSVHSDGLDSAEIRAAELAKLKQSQPSHAAKPGKKRSHSPGHADQALREDIEEFKTSEADRGDQKSRSSTDHESETSAHSKSRSQSPDQTPAPSEKESATESRAKSTRSQRSKTSRRGRSRSSKKSGSRSVGKQSRSRTPKKIRLPSPSSTSQKSMSESPKETPGGESQSAGSAYLIKTLLSEVPKFESMKCLIDTSAKPTSNRFLSKVEERLDGLKEMNEKDIKEVLKRSYAKYHTKNKRFGDATKRLDHNSDPVIHAKSLIRSSASSIHSVVQSPEREINKRRKKGYDRIGKVLGKLGMLETDLMPKDTKRMVTAALGIGKDARRTLDFLVGTLTPREASDSMPSQSD